MTDAEAGPLTLAIRVFVGPGHDDVRHDDLRPSGELGAATAVSAVSAAGSTAGGPPT